MDPNRPPKNVEPGVPADKPPAYDVAMGVPASAGQPVQVDAYGRPIVNAVPAPPGQMHVHTQVVPNNANIRRDAQGNALCNKCAAPYPLPAGCTSWRCRNCGELNNASVYGDECCVIL